jgi:apolipoprotein N-acyltransferase
VAAEPFLWTAPGALLLVLWAGRPKPATAFGLGFAFGYAFFAGCLLWLTEVTAVGPFVLAAYLALFPAAFALFAATAGRPRFDFGSRSLFGNSVANLYAATANASAWTGLEWLRATAFTGFGWNGLGTGLWQNLTLAQLAELAGATGLSALVVFCSSVGAGLVLRLAREFRTRRLRPHLDLAVMAAALAAAAGYGLAKLAAPVGRAAELRVLVVQPNIPQDAKWDEAFTAEIFDTLRTLTEPLTATFDYDLVVWPEASLPYPLDYPVSRDFLTGVLGSSGKRFPLLLGTNLDVPFEGAYNAVALLDGSVDSRQTYHKVHLVPFGEYIPLRGKFPPFEWAAGDLIQWDFSAGTSTDPLDLPRTEIGVIPAICFEDTLGDLARRFVRPGPQLIVNVTNDGWFRRSAGADQHLANATLRAIELRRPLLRCANTGVSCLVSPTGAVTEKIADPATGDTFIAQARPFTVLVPLDPPTTFYARHGDAFSIAALVLACLLALAHPWRARR